MKLFALSLVALFALAADPPKAPDVPANTSIAAPAPAPTSVLAPKSTEPAKIELPAIDARLQVKLVLTQMKVNEARHALDNANEQIAKLAGKDLVDAAKKAADELQRQQAILDPLYQQARGQCKGAAAVVKQDAMEVTCEELKPAPLPAPRK